MTEAKGDELYKEAEAKLTGWGWFTSKRDKMEEAADLFIKAANQYKIAKKWSKAGKAFSRASEINLEVSHGTYTAAANYVNAATCYHKENKSEAINCYRSAVKLFLEDGKLGTAAKHMKSIAEISEEEGKITDALVAYQSAADYFEADGGFQSQCTACLLKVAYMAAEAQELDKAVNILEKVAQSCVGNNLLKFKVKDYCMEAGICRIGLGDYVACRKAWDSYVAMQPELVRSREFVLLDSLLQACENYDGDAFSEAVTEYDSLKQLAPWQTSILLKVKEKLDADDEQDDLT
eukprot:TRINITY_DN17094_c0_g1_i1.p1 TRINITY_DN17094_c0_g1~~TRINITY_DN17094_c0_g1_i1.p1  ORF type:complete len:292 (+),score=88.98 TRINITY_DN17094_c0_g1_i1:18-893(+)